MAKTKIDNSQRNAPEPIVDFDGAMVRLGGDRELFREFIAVYDEDMPTLVQALNEALSHLNGNELQRNAHSLRGLISNFGARRAVESAQHLEDVAKNDRWPEASASLNTLMREIALLSEALEEYRK